MDSSPQSSAASTLAWFHHHCNSVKTTSSGRLGLADYSSLVTPDNSSAMPHEFILEHTAVQSAARSSTDSTLSARAIFEAMATETRRRKRGQTREAAATAIGGDAADKKRRRLTPLGASSLTIGNVSVTIVEQSASSGGSVLRIAPLDPQDPSPALQITIPGVAEESDAESRLRQTQSGSEETKRISLGSVATAATGTTNTTMSSAATVTTNTTMSSAATVTTNTTMSSAATVTTNTTMSSAAQCPTCGLTTTGASRMSRRSRQPDPEAAYHAYVLSELPTITPLGPLSYATSASSGASSAALDLWRYQVAVLAERLGALHHLRGSPRPKPPQPGPLQDLWERKRVFARLVVERSVSAKVFATMRLLKGYSCRDTHRDMGPVAATTAGDGSRPEKEEDIGYDDDTFGLAQTAAEVAAVLESGATGVAGATIKSASQYVTPTAIVKLMNAVAFEAREITTGRSVAADYPSEDIFQQATAWLRMLVHRAPTDAEKAAMKLTGQRCFGVSATSAPTVAESVAGDHASAALKRVSRERMDAALPPLPPLPVHSSNGDLAGGIPRGILRGDDNRRRSERQRRQSSSPASDGTKKSTGRLSTKKLQRRDLLRSVATPSKKAGKSGKGDFAAAMTTRQSLSPLRTTTGNSIAKKEQTPLRKMFSRSKLTS